MIILHIVAFMSLLSEWKIAKQLLSNFNLENVNLLSNLNINPKNEVAYKKTRSKPQMYRCEIYP